MLNMGFVVDVPRTGVYVQTYPRILQKVDPQQSVIVGGFWQTMNVVAITRSASPTLTRATRTFSHLPDPQEGRTESRTSRDVRTTSAPPWPNPTPVVPTASGETSSLPQTRPDAPICWIDSPESRALPPLTGKSRGPGTPLDLTVRSRRRGPTPPPPPRASNEGHFSDTDLPPTATTSTRPPPCHSP
jgi:hypothetical protein